MMKNTLLLLAVLLSFTLTAQDTGTGTGIRTDQLAGSATDNTVPVSVGGAVSYRLITGDIITIDPSQLDDVNGTDLQTVLEEIGTRITNVQGATNLGTNATELTSSTGTNVLKTDVAPIQAITVNGNPVNPNAAGLLALSFTDTDTQRSDQEIRDVIAAVGYLTVEVDGSTTNEIQTLSRTGNVGSLSRSGGTLIIADNITRGTITATAGQTAFTLPSTPRGGQARQIYFRNGIRLKESQYTRSGATVTLTFSLGAGEEFSYEYAL